MNRQKSRRAAALVVVLSVVVLLCLIIVSFSVAMRMERQSAYYFSERARADFMAKEGVEIVKSLITDTYSEANNFVVSTPGQIAYRSSGTWNTIDLASGLPSTNYADLNRPNKTGDALRQIDPLGGPMRLSWIYVYQNGNRVTNSSPPIAAQNPIIGRYAYWTDDESTRINLNTAWKPSGDTNNSPLNTNNNYSDTRQVALAGISSLIGDNANAIYTDTKVRPYSSLGESAHISAILSSNLSTNRFVTTVYNHSPDLNPWGEPKIFLTTQLSNLPPRYLAMSNYSRYYLDILRTNNVDPGVLDYIDYAKLSTVINRLNGYLSRTDWPLFAGKNYASKFKSYNTNRITQLSLDIIEYVRSAESSYTNVSPLRIAGSGATYASTSADIENYIGTTRHPLINEIQFWVGPQTNSSPTALTNFSKAQAKVEIYYPEHYGNTNQSLIGEKLNVSISAPTVFSDYITADMVTNYPNGYSVITTRIFDALQQEALATNSSGEVVHNSAVLDRNQKAKVRVWLTRGTNVTSVARGEIWDIVPNGSAILYQFNTNAPDISSMKSMEVDDPRLNKVGDYWREHASGNSFGAKNSISQPNPTASPQQDTDANGKCSDFSLFMPPPRNTPGNLKGVVSSVAEIGRINTGVENASNSAARGVGWRTIRLQPTSSGDSEIPDSALLDLFTVPASTSNSSIYFPATNVAAGRINLNTSIAPYFTNSKTQPLVALAAGGNLSISNIVTHTLAAGGRTFGYSNFYKFPGELAEIAGISSTGESSETNLLPIVGLATTRSTVFRIYTVGQSIQQTPNGTLRINATKSVETVVEAVGTGSSTRFRSVSWRENPF